MAALNVKGVMEKGSNLKRLFGTHAIIEVCGKQSHFNEKELVGLMTSAANAAGATILKSEAHDFGEGSGDTAVLLLAESHITVHTWPEHDYAAFDIFMCCSETQVMKAANVITDADRDGVYDISIIKRKKPQSVSKPKELANA